MLRLNRALKLGGISRIAMRNSRAFGGHAGGHDDHHGEGGDYHTGGIYQPTYHAPPAKPYDAHHEHIDRTQAFIFGEDPAHPKEAEGWETMSYITLLVSAFILGYSHYTKGEDPLRKWARQEALAREKVIAKGEKVEYGRFYHTEEEFTQTEFSSENVGVAPEKSE